MNAYAKCFDRNGKYMNLLVHDKEILKKYSEIQDENKVNYLKKIFIVNHCIKINTLKLK